MKSRNQSNIQATSTTLFLDAITRLEGAGLLLLASISMATNSIASGFQPFGSTLDTQQSASQLANKGHAMLFKPLAINQEKVTDNLLERRTGFNP